MQSNSIPVVFVSFILIISSFLIAIPFLSSEAEAICWWNNYDSGKACRDNPDCPSTYSSGNNCYYNFCDCSGADVGNKCFYDSVDTNKPVCPYSKKYSPTPGECSSGGYLECTSSGWECTYTTEYYWTETEGEPGSLSCEDGIDNDCDGKIDLADGDCMGGDRCDDPDGTSIITKGTCTSATTSGTTGVEYEDGCYGPTTVREAVCVDEFNCGYTSIECPQGNFCSYGGTDYGRCMVPGALPDGICGSTGSADDGAPCDCDIECPSQVCASTSSGSCSEIIPICQPSKNDAIKWAYSVRNCPTGSGSGGCEKGAGWIYACSGWGDDGTGGTAGPKSCWQLGQGDCQARSDCQWCSSGECLDAESTCPTDYCRDTAPPSGISCSLDLCDNPEEIIIDMQAGNAVTDCISRIRALATSEGVYGKWYKVKGALGQEVNITLENSNCNTIDANSGVQLVIFNTNSCSIAGKDFLDGPILGQITPGETYTIEKMPPGGVILQVMTQCRNEGTRCPIPAGSIA